VRASRRGAARGRCPDRPSKPGEPCDHGWKVRLLRRSVHPPAVVGSAQERAGALMGVIRSAASTEPDIADLWARIQADFHDTQRGIVKALHTRKALRRGLGVARAADVLWTLNHPDLWLLLVGERGWTPAEWERWFTDVARSQLLVRASTPPRTTP